MNQHALANSSYFTHCRSDAENGWWIVDACRGYWENNVGQNLADLCRGICQAGRKELGMLLLAWFGILAAYHWDSFRFTDDLSLLGNRLENATWMPFADYDHRDHARAVHGLAAKLLLFVPGGVLLTLVLRSLGWSATGGRVVLLALVVAALVEAGQLAASPASVTPLVLQGIGAWLGFACARRILIGSAYNPAMLATSDSILEYPMKSRTLSQDRWPLAG